MGKKIMILNGSPRANGNTAALIEAFTKGAQEAGNEVSCFDLQRMNIHPCLGCCKGGRNPDSPCVQKDDMDKIYPAYREADVVVLASPLYYWTISGQLKCAFDRLFAVAECDANYANPTKESALLMAAEGYGFEETLYWYDRIMNHIHWTDKDVDEHKTQLARIKLVDLSDAYGQYAELDEQLTQAISQLILEYNQILERYRAALKTKAESVYTPVTQTKIGLCEKVAEINAKLLVLEQKRAEFIAAVRKRKTIESDLLQINKKIASLFCRDSYATYINS